MASPLLDGRTVAVVGAGPVGLMTAVLLRQRGVDVTVHERDPGPKTRSLGSTLDIHADRGQRALAAAGLLERFRELARPTAERIADADGAVLIEEPVDEATAYDRPEIDRADLYRLLLAELPPESVVWGQSFRTLDDRDGRFHLHFADRPDVVADVVIGASGGRSRVRPYVTDAVPEYSGTFAIGGEIADPETRCPAFHALVDGGNLMVRGGGKALFAHTHADGTVDYYLSFRGPSAWLAQRGIDGARSEPVVALLAEELAGWADVYHEAFRATSEFKLLALYRLPLAPDRLVTRPITLVGDAAHLMPPFAGLGVNLGLMDSLHLVDNLTDGRFTSVEDAIRAYERTSYGYAQAAQEETAAAEIALHSDMSWGELLAATRGGPEPRVDGE